MAKKKESKETKTDVPVQQNAGLPADIKEIEEKLPQEVKEKLMAMKEKLEKFKKSIIEKFDKYITGVALLPPPKEKPKEEEFHVLVLIDDTEPHKMSKQELKEKLSTIIETSAGEIDKKIKTQTILLSEVWQNCYDGKYDILQLIALSAPIHDTGTLAAIKIAEVHKTMTLKKFEKYIVSYVLAGSIVQGRATAASDIDVFIVIDDTDVKKMTRAELKDKLRAIIIDMGYQAGEITGIKNKINIQVYILTDFWESIREANPVIFTFLRDGVPFYDRGIFMPWKQLLKMGKIKPSHEAIDMYMSSGEQVLDRVKFKLKDIGTEDFFWAIFTPSQAALMLYGVPPPSPKETPELMREIFVKKEKLLTDADIRILEKVLKVRKEVEHGTKKDVTGKEIDELVENCDKYLKRVKRLFTQIEKIKEAQAIIEVYETTVTVVRDLLRLEGMEKIPEKEMAKYFETKCITTGKIPAKFCRMLEEIFNAKKEFDSGKLTKTDVEQTKKTAGEFIKNVVEYMQRKRAREIERAKIRVKYGEKMAEVTLLGAEAFVIRDLSADEKVMEKCTVKEDGTLSSPEKSSWEDMEKSLAKIDIPARVFIKEKLFEGLKKIFGKDLEIILP